jgi:hypothetical protein
MSLSHLSPVELAQFFNNEIIELSSFMVSLISNKKKKKEAHVCFILMEKTINIGIEKIISAYARRMLKHTTAIRNKDKDYFLNLNIESELESDEKENMSQIAMLKNVWNNDVVLSEKQNEKIWDHLLMLTYVAETYKKSLDNFGNY